MIIVESKIHEKHKPDWSFRVGESTFFTRDVADRIKSIDKWLKKDLSLVWREAKSFPKAEIKKLHSYHDYIENICKNMKDEKTQFLPDIFPGRDFQPKKNMNSPFLMGYYCASAVTPIMKNTYAVAKASVDTALTGAQLLYKKECQEVYALCRPPGHHAGPRVFGGYCYFNNVAVAANWLSKYGKVAILDIDHHHGDGTQEHFISRPDIFTCSIHGNPAEDYPYLTGYKDEVGTGKGKGSNFNIPIPLNTKVDNFLKALAKAKRAIGKFQPDFLIVAAGFDTYEKDPVGHCKLKIKDFKKIGNMIAQWQFPTLICQEGGYEVAALGECAYQFIQGFKAGR